MRLDTHPDSILQSLEIGSMSGADPRVERDAEEAVDLTAYSVPVTKRTILSFGQEWVVRFGY